MFVKQNTHYSVNSYLFQWKLSRRDAMRQFVDALSNVRLVLDVKQNFTFSAKAHVFELSID